MWSIAFYGEDKRQPVRNFLESLDITTQGRFRWSIEKLRERAPGGRPPLAYHLGGLLWELREESQMLIYHLTFFYYSNEQEVVVLLHGFPQNPGQTFRGVPSDPDDPPPPPGEIAEALRRLDNFLNRERLQ